MVPMDEIPIQEWACYADESSITGAKHSVVGGTVVRSDRLQFVLHGIAALRTKHKMFAELKWSKISNQKYDAYLDFVKFFFTMRARGYLAFHATTFENSKWNHRKWNENDSDIGLSKLYYQMLLHQYVRDYGDVASLYICLDRRRSSTSLDDFHRILNAGAAKDYNLTFGPVRVMTSKDSKKSDMLQVNDIILGAVAAHKNGRHLLNETRSSKRDLANIVASNASLERRPGEAPSKSFTVWNFMPR